MNMRTVGYGCVCLLLLAQWAQAQERWLQGTVVHPGQHNERIPEVNITVTITGTDNSDTTNAHGLFRVFLPEIYTAGEPVRLTVDKPDWRILDPVDGEATVPKELPKTLIDVRLAPVGSKLFLSHDHIEKLFRDVAAKSTQQARPGGTPEEIDFSRYIPARFSVRGYE